MTCSLFHCFDPYVALSVWKFILYISLKWIVMIFVVVFVNWQVFSFKSGLDLFMKKLLVLVWGSFNSLVKGLKGFFSIIFCLIFLILMMNLMGLVPFMFSISSHLTFNLSFSLSLWLSGVLVSLFKSLNNFFSHMVPVGSPFLLWVFLVLVESISLFIRPFTLAVRLMANVMAGHMIMGLVGLLISSSDFFTSLLLMESAFMFFEVCVSLVQTYVFVSLLALYWDES